MSVFTLGYLPAYRKGLATQGKQFRKLGRTSDYQGGSVWKTAKDVFRHIANNADRLWNYGVFEVDAEWGVDTEPTQCVCGDYHDLLKTSRILREVFRVDDNGKSCT